MKEQPIELIGVKALQDKHSNLVDMEFIFKNNLQSKDTKFLEQEAKKYILDNILFCHCGYVKMFNWKDCKCKIFGVSIHFNVCRETVFKKETTQ